MRTSNIIAVALAATLYTAGLTSCGDDYDDTGIKGQISALDKRVTTLEDKVKTDIAGIQAAINTINGNDYVKSIKEVEDGYEITFSKGTVATIKKGLAGKDGEDGADGIDGVTPVLTVDKDSDGKFYWKVNGAWLMNGTEKVPTSKTPVMTVDEYEGQKYWKIDGEWLTDADGNKVAFGEVSTPTNFDAKVNEDGTVSFIFGTNEYKMTVASGGLTIVDPYGGAIFNGTPLTYQVALPTGWTADDLDAVRADVESASASGVGITRATAAWTVATTKTETGADVTVTGTDISVSEVAELTVTFVKKTGERLSGSIFMTVWASNSSAATITADGSGNVATTIAGYMSNQTVNPKITIDGSTAMTAADWQALKDYKYLSELTISNTAASAVMPADAFKGCTTLTKVILTSSKFAAIPAGAFEGCTELTVFTGIADITAIGDNAFKGCAKLQVPTTVTGVASVGAHAFEGCKTAAIAANTFANLTSIGQYAFSGCEAMTALPALATTVTALPAGVFKNCKGLTTTSVTLANVTSIGDEAFYGCNPITAATFAAATTIGNRAFYGCNQMTTAALEKATTVGDAAFAGCKLMTSLTLGTVTSVGTDAFKYAIPGSCAVTLGKGTTVGNPNTDLTLWLDMQWKTVTVRQ